MCPALVFPTSAFVEATRDTWEGEDLLFGEVEGVGQPPAQMATASEAAAAAADWMQQAKLELTLPAAAQQVQAAAESLLRGEPWLGSSPYAFAQALASRLPRVQFMLRSANARTPGQHPAAPAGAAPWSALHHTFLLAVMPDSGEQYVVEPDFAGHFQLAGAGRVYSAVLGALPRPLVASPPQVHHLVKQLQALMAAETLMVGRSLAPWRSASALLSKFFPTRFADTPVLPLPQSAGQLATAGAAGEPTSPLAAASDRSAGSSLATPNGPSPDSVLPGPADATTLAAAARKAAAALGGSALPPAPAMPLLAPPATSIPRSKAAPSPRLVVVGFEVPATPGMKEPQPSAPLPPTRQVLGRIPAGPPQLPATAIAGKLVAGQEVKRAPAPAAGLLQPKALLVTGTPPGHHAANPLPAYVALLPRCITVKPRGLQGPHVPAAAVAAGVRTPLPACAA